MISRREKKDGSPSKGFSLKKDDEHEKMNAGKEREKNTDKSSSKSKNRGCRTGDAFQML